MNNNAREKEDDTLEVTPEAPGDSNKTGDNSEVQTLSDESNDRVKLDNILTISEDNGNEAPGGSGLQTLQTPLLHLEPRVAPTQKRCWKVPPTITSSCSTTTRTLTQEPPAPRSN